MLRKTFSQLRELKTQEKSHDILADNYMFKVNNRTTRTRCEISSKLTIKTPERRQWRHSGVFIINFEQFFTPCSSVSIVKFEHANADWVTQTGI